MSHTKGPWRAEGKAMKAVEAQAFDGSWKYVVDRVRGGNPTEAKCNQSLIAAAPDLLAALKAYRDDHRFELDCAAFERESVGDNTEIDEVDHRCHLCVIADAVISKAEGQ